MSDCLAVWVFQSEGDPLRCHLEEGHQDLHWDKDAQMAWFPWSSEQEAAAHRIAVAAWLPGAKT